MSLTTIKIDDETKKEAQILFKSLGMNLSTAINIFLKQSIKEQGIPFYIKDLKPSEKLIKALQEVEEIEKGVIKTKKFNNANEALEDALKDE